MALRGSIRRAVQGVINSGLDDIPVTVTLRSTVTGVYNPVTGSATKTVTDVSLKAVLANITQKDTNDLELLTRGKKVLIAGLDLGELEIDALDDTVIINGDRFQLKSYKVDPTGALYSLMIVNRSPK